MDLKAKTHLIQIAAGAIVIVVIVTIAWEIYSSVFSSSESQFTASIPATVPARKPSGDPLDVIDRLKPSFPELLAWRTSWEASSAASRPILPSDLQNLNDLIEATDINAGDLLSVGQYVLGKGDKKVAAVWFRRGVDQGEAELAAARKKNPEDSDEDLDELVVRPLLAKGMDDAGRLFWEPQFEDGRVEEKLCKMELALSRENQWDQRPEWIAIGLGESYCLEHRYDEALAQANQCLSNQNTNTHWTIDQTTDLQWLMGLAFSDMEKFSDAIPHLEIAAKSETFWHANDVSKALIIAYSMVGRADDAERQLKDYVLRYKTDSDGAERLRKVIDLHRQAAGLKTESNIH